MKETRDRLDWNPLRYPLEAIYQQLQEELRSQYSLGYTPPLRQTRLFARLKSQPSAKG